MPDLSTVLGWVISVAVPLLIGIGVGLMSTAPPEFTAAKVCFTLSATVWIVGVSWWLLSLEVRDVWRIVAVFFVFGCVGASWAASWKWVDTRSNSRINATLESQVISRLYALTNYPPPGRTLIPLEFQELFYQWKIVLIPDRDTSKVFITLTGLALTDRVTVSPE